jgi:hypothetical protein
VRALLLIAAVFAAGCGAAAEEPRDATLHRYGISVTLPSGWTGHIEHGAIRARGPGATVDIFEDEERPGESEVYPPGRPRLSPEDVGEEGSALRRLFSLSGRRFVVFVAPRDAPLAAVNDLLASLEVEPGDFYPGEVAPARFAPRRGWHLGTSGPSDVRAEGEFVTSWAATIPYRDTWNALPPSETLERLPPDGILIWVALTRTNRFEPEYPAASLPVRVADMDCHSSWEGQVRDLPECVLWATLHNRAQLEVRVYFGDPGVGELADEADAMLHGLKVPPWPPWES